MSRVRLWLSAALAAVSASAASAAVRIDGRVPAGGAAIANSTVTLWEASAGEPRQLAQAKTDSVGRFEISAEETPDPNVSFYLIAKGGAATASHTSGDNPALALLSVLGGAPPAKVVVNEMTTVASVWTNEQFLDGAAIRSHALGLRVAAGNVPNFVDLTTGGYGGAIQEPFNSRRRRPWRISRRCRRCLRVALRGSRPTPATSCSRRRHRRTAKFRQTH
jgi:hypothetical protein